MKNNKIIAAIAVTAAVFASVSARRPPPPTNTDLNATEPQFRELYKELVETHTAQSVGSCTLAAERVAARMRAAGFADADLRLFAPVEYPKAGGLVATLQGSDPTKKAILLLAHIDVVEANREDWVRDPFTLIEEGGYFYARGAFDDKAMAAYFTDILINYKREGFIPQRSIKLALTCGEETSTWTNGAQWLAANHRDWIDAEFAINEGAGGELNESGARVALNVQAGEKVNRNFTLETTNPGGHSSQPVPQNAIYDMSRALNNIAQLEFPVQLNEVTRTYFTRSAALQPPEIASAMRAIVANPQDAGANAILSRNKQYHSMLRTTCVATMVEGGHAKNALPQRVRANVNCRVFPGVSNDEVKNAIVGAINNPNVSVTLVVPNRPATPTPALTAQVLGPIEAIAARHFPNVPIIPTMATGATDATYISAVGIPTYGFSAIFSDGTSNMHGLNERVLVKSVMEARKFQYELIKYYSTH
jgi:acetylornithine deacetylase/succinyl-diaminopimelate desuccinylase-like protein